MRYGPQQEFAQDLYREKYCGTNETIREAYDRIAIGLADDAKHLEELLPILGEQRFLPAGRIQSSIGSKRDTTAFNCFVSGKIDDSFVDGDGSIMHRLHQASTTMRMGGGIGYNFSGLRPAKALIRRLESHSSGFLSFMHIYDANGLACSSAGHRRGAQMGVLNVDHPDIESFITCKQAPADAKALVDHLDKLDPADPSYWPMYQALQATLPLRGFNISVGLKNDFMQAVDEGRGSYDLKFGGRVVKTIDPMELWEKLMQSTWAWAEPGAMFLDTINEWNNLWYCETIDATNPCGEQPLPAFGACLLGSFNLVKYVYQAENGKWVFDINQLRRDIPHVVRAMDNVVDRTRYPLRDQEREAQQKRRMGIGVTGLANALEVMGLPYGSRNFLMMEGFILGEINVGCYQAGVELAKEKGAFLAFDAERYCSGKFIKTLPFDLQADIRRYGVRNSHYTSLAPTGTISFTADNVSSSIEPVFAYSTERKVNRAAGKVVQVISDYGFREFGVKGRRTCDVTIDEHVNVLAVAQQFVDSAVSKTCNVPPNTPWADFKSIYMNAWKLGCKGITTFQTGGRRAGILTSKDEPAESSCSVDAVTGRKSCE